MEPGVGIEPTTYALQVRCSTTELTRLVRERCDTVVSIPMLGQVSSLNVSAAAALATYEVTRARLASPA